MAAWATIAMLPPWAAGPARPPPTLHAPSTPLAPAPLPRVPCIPALLAPPPPAACAPAACTLLCLRLHLTPRAARTPPALYAACAPSHPPRCSHPPPYPASQGCSRPPLHSCILPPPLHPRAAHPPPIPCAAYAPTELCAECVPPYPPPYPASSAVVIARCCRD